MKARNKVTGNLETVYVKVRDNTPIGTIFEYVGATAPVGYLMCDGSTFSQSLYPELYQILGSTTLPTISGSIIKAYHTNLSSSSDIVNEYSTSSENAYSCAYINEHKEEYSTDEVRIGTWIDGKPIYRKCFAGVNSGYSFSIGNFPNIKAVINLYGSFNSNGANIALENNWSGTGFSKWLLNGNTINFEVGSDLSGWNHNIIVEYTKTTD